MILAVFLIGLGVRGVAALRQAGRLRRDRPHGDGGRPRAQPTVSSARRPGSARAPRCCLARSTLKPLWLNGCAPAVDDGPRAEYLAVPCRRSADQFGLGGATRHGLAATPPSMIVADG